MHPRGVLLIGLVAACRGPSSAPLYPAGTDQDDGYGDLAQKSASLVTSATDAPPWAPHHRRPRDGDSGDPYGGTADPDTADAHPAPDRRPITYEVREAGLSGAVEGTVTWRGARPASMTTACGPVAPGVRVAANGAAGGALVLIEHVRAGRNRPHDDGVGGVVVKHGCGLAPALQVVTALPRALVIHGDATAATLQVTEPGPQPGDRLLPDEPRGPPPPFTFALPPASRITLAARRGITRIEAADGSLSAAWVVATDATYFALTDDAGRYRLDELVPGSYELTVLVAPPATADHGVLRYGPPLVVHRAIQVGPVQPLHLDISVGSVSARGP